MGLRPQDVLWPPSHIILTARHIALFSKSFVNCLVPYFGAVRSISALLFYRLWSDAQVVVLRSRDLLRVIPQTRLFLFHSNRISPQCLFFDIPCLTACSVSIWPPVIPWLLKLELNVGSSKKKKKEFFFCQLDVKHWVPYSLSRVPGVIPLPWPGDLLSPHLKLGYFHGNDTKSSSENSLTSLVWLARRDFPAKRLRKKRCLSSQLWREKNSI